MRKVHSRLVGGRTPRRVYDGFTGKLAQAIDTVVGLFAPGWVKHRLANRMRGEAMLAFEAAVVDRMMPRENPQSADAEVLPNLATMRARSRRQTQDDGHAESAVTVYVDAVVGPGIKAQCGASSARTGATEKEVMDWRTRANAYFEEWTNKADATAHGTFYDLQALVARTRKVDGESFTHVVVEQGQAPVIEQIDADRIGNPKDQLDTMTLRQGVQIDAKGKPTGYWVANVHPGDTLLGSSVAYTFVPAREGDLQVVHHHFRRQRTGQTRGYPDGVSSAQYLDHLHHYLKSEIIGARAAANYAVFIRKAVSELDADLSPVQSQSASGDVTTVYHEKLEAGTIAYLNEGEEPVAFNPNRPGAGDEFVKRMLRAIAASHGMSYERMARDFGGMNYSSMRGQLKEEQRGFDRDRSLLIRQFCNPVWRAVILHGVQSGELQPPRDFLAKLDAWLAVNWVPPAMGWVDPQKEIQASRDAIEANLSTPWHEASRAGLDPIEVLERRAEFFARAAEIEARYKLPAGTLSGVAAQEPQAAPGADPAAAAASDTSNPMADGTATIETERMRLDALGIAVRSGLVTPSSEVEESVRQALGLPAMGSDVVDAWGAEPTRRPITIAQLKESPTIQAEQIDANGNPTDGSSDGSASQDGSGDAAAQDGGDGNNNDNGGQ